MPITIGSTNGGTGQTTLAANLGGFLAHAIGSLQDLGVLTGDTLLSPIPPEIPSAQAFARGALSMLDRLKPMQHIGAPVGHLYGLCYRMDRWVDARRVAERLRRNTVAKSRGGISILDTVVPATIAYGEAASAQIPVHEWEAQRRDSTGGTRDHERAGRGTPATCRYRVYGSPAMTEAAINTPGAAVTAPIGRDRIAVCRGKLATASTHEAAKGRWEDWP